MMDEKLEQSIQDIKNDIKYFRNIEFDGYAEKLTNCLNIIEVLKKQIEIMSEKTDE